MPHVIIKLYRGRSEEQKAKLAAQVTKAVMDTLNASEGSVSVGIEDIEPEDWAETVYRPDILGRSETIYKKPGYSPL
jgi:4-oxalocrotonate tautomerase